MSWTSARISVQALIVLCAWRPWAGAGPAAVTTLSVDQLKKHAMAYEQAGDKLKAAETYEQIAAQDQVSRHVVAYRLAKLYAESGVTNKALEWAAVVMSGHPDPQPYLAGIHALLGDYDAAEQILKAEIRASRRRTDRGRMVLRWQLADVYERRGDGAKAESELAAAAKLARGSADEAGAGRRLASFREREVNRNADGVRTNAFPETTSDME